MPEQRKYQDREDDDPQQECGSTADMSRGERLDRPRGQWCAGLVGVNRLVLCAVVLEYPPHPAHTSYQQKVDDKEAEAQHSLLQIARHRALEAVAPGSG